MASRSSMSPEPSPELTACRAAFREWLGPAFDLDSLDAMLCALAVERLDGDPVWLLVISGSGATKTELVRACSGAGAHVVSTISGEAALLSGTAISKRHKRATGGLLREIGQRGVLVVKDFTSILSMNRDRRAEVLGALREVHDGAWVRKMGVDGGRTLSWWGRVVVIGAVTTAWDRAHTVVAAMGDRFVLVRTDSSVNRLEAGRQAMANIGSEELMREDLADAVELVYDAVDIEADLSLSHDDQERLLAAANLTCLIRTAVDYDFKGSVIDSHAPEMPTRFAKQLQQIVRGGVAIGMPRNEALRLTLRLARDSVPPLRLVILEDVHLHPGSTTADVERRLKKPRSSIDRQLQSLQFLRVLEKDVEEPDEKGKKAKWVYYVADGIRPEDIGCPEYMRPAGPVGMPGAGSRTQ